MEEMQCYFRNDILSDNSLGEQKPLQYKVITKKMGIDISW
jgi:hypothetical protein